MSSPRRLSRLREDLELLPSPVADRPGLLIRDPYRYSDACIVVPPLLVRSLSLFDGSSLESDLHAGLDRTLSGSRISAPEVAERLIEVLSTSGFLQDARFGRLRADRHRAFGEAAERAPAHAGAGYPMEEAELSTTLAGWAPAEAGPAAAGGGRLVGIAAPHASPSADPASYAAAYQSLEPGFAHRTFVILGTSHYGAPDRLGLTRKPFRTPLGLARTDARLVDELLRAAPEAFELEDYCHAIEHSIEFQVLFLQSRFGPDVRILPVLCGPLSCDGGAANPPGSDGKLAAGLAALGELHARHGEALCWVLGVDMAHVGTRYGDAQGVQANDDTMSHVAARDRERIDTLVAGDAGRFWARVHESGDDDLRWCGVAPLYAFLRAVPGARARLLRYHQWNIDPASVVSFAALSFHV